MAVTIKDNQALEFTNPSADPTAIDICGCGGSYCQPVQTNDLINIQGTVTENSTTNLSELASWNFGTGWSNDSGVIVGDGVPTDTIQAISNALGLGTNSIYSIYINASVRFVYNGSMIFGASNSIVIGTLDDIRFVAGGQIIITGTALNDGAYTIVSFVLGGLGWVVTVVETTIVDEVITATAIIPGGGAIVPDGGYRFKFNGSYLELPIVSPDTTGDFTSQPYLLRYAIMTGGAIVDDRIRVECSSPDIIVEINSIIIRNVSRVGAALYKNGAFVVSSDAPSGISYYPLNTYISNYSGMASLAFTPILFNYTITISTLFGGGLDGCYQISLYDSFGEVDDPKTAVSNCMEIKETHPCTLVFNASNDDNAFGFDYTTGTGFQHFLRVYSKMDVTAYPEEVETPYIFSNNNRVLMFARRDKEYTLFIGDAPNHIHDLLSIMRLHDTFSIGTNIFTDLVAYTKESGYELNRRKTSNLKQATFTVRETQGLASNFPCN